MVLGQETLLSSGKVALAGLTGPTIDQLVPFQRSANVLWPLFEKVPTAMQLVLDAHETPRRTVEVAPAGLGLVTIDHVVPFQRSTNDLGTKLLSSYVPTTKQFVVPEHDTPFRSREVVPVG